MVHPSEDGVNRAADAVPSGDQSAQKCVLSRRSSVVLVLLIPAGLALLSLCARAVLASPVLSAAGLCPFYRLTGLRCPLCGGTHGFIALLEGRFLEALRFNPLTTSVAFAGIWMYIRLTASCFTRPFRPYMPVISRRLIVAAVAAVVCFTIVRNTQLYKAYLF